MHHSNEIFKQINKLILRFWTTWAGTAINNFFIMRADFYTVIQLHMKEEGEGAIKSVVAPMT